MQKAPSPATETSAQNQALIFIARWQGVALTEATELSSSQTFILELCALLGVDTPLPTKASDYMFERPITFAHGDGSSSPGRIDCYRRGHFVWESKKFKYLAKGGAAHGTAMLTARAQAEGYARALPQAELAAGRPPFFWWPTLAMSLSCTASSPAAAQPMCRFLTRAATALL